MKQGFRRWSQLAKWRPSLNEVEDLAKEIAREWVNTEAAEKAKEAGDDWTAHEIYFLRDTLLFCEFEQAVSHADPGRVERVLRY